MPSQLSAASPAPANQSNGRASRSAGSQKAGNRPTNLQRVADEVFGSSSSAPQSSQQHDESAHGQAAQLASHSTQRTTGDVELENTQQQQVIFKSHLGIPLCSFVI